MVAMAALEAVSGTPPHSARADVAAPREDLHVLKMKLFQVDKCVMNGRRQAASHTLRAVVTPP